MSSGSTAASTSCRRPSCASSLRHLPAWTARRREIAAFYLRELEGAGLGLPREQEYATAVYHLFVVRHPRRDALAAGAARRAASARSSTTRSRSTASRRSHRSRKASRLPNVERAAAEILSLPLYPELTDAQAAAVVAAVRKATRCRPVLASQTA